MRAAAHRVAVRSPREKTPVTILLGFVVDDFVMLSADTRASQLGPEGLILFDDDTQKIFRTGFGLIAGAGWYNLVHNVIDRLQDPPASNVETAEMLRQERDKTGIPSTDPRIDNTSWLITYGTGAPEIERIGLAYCHPQADYSPQAIQSPGYFLLKPWGMSDEAESSLRLLLDRTVKESAKICDLNERRRLFATVIESTVRKAAKMCNSVGSRFQIGLHVRREARISPIVNDISEINGVGVD